LERWILKVDEMYSTKTEIDKLKSWAEYELTKFGRRSKASKITKIANEMESRKLEYFKKYIAN
jgi:hypothetical protein